MPDARRGRTAANNITGPVLHFFGRYFGVPYPLPKLDLAAVPDFAAGAMENWGLMIFRETALLYDAAESSAVNLQRVAIVIAHESAHLWFGDLVTMTWWTDLWLKEGFATYMEYLGVNAVFPSWRLDDQFLVEDQQTALLGDALPSSRPIQADVSDPSQISSLYDAISYSKGASIIRMLRGYVGDAVFETGVTQYLQRYAYGSVSTRDFWAAITEAAHNQSVDIDVGRVMGPWTTQAGYPLLTIDTVPVAGSANVSGEQARFMLVNPGGAVDGSLWQVPLTCDTQRGRRIVLLVAGTQTFQFPYNAAQDGWLRCNTNQTGFYRVNYKANSTDPAPVNGNWALLQAALASPTDRTGLTAADRAGLYDDAYALSRAGIASPLLPFELSRSGMPLERDYIVWQTAIRQLAFVQSRMQANPVYGKLETFVRDMLAPTIAAVGGWNAPADLPHLTRLLRTSVLSAAVAYNDPWAIGNATALFARFVANATQSRPPADIRPAVYAAGIRYGGVAEWDFLWRQYTNSSVAAERQRCLTALAETRVPWLLSRYLQYTLDPTKVRVQDAVSAIVAVAANPVLGLQLAWRFLQDNYDELARRFVDSGAGSGLSNIIMGICGRFQTTADLSATQAFLAGLNQQVTPQVISTVEANIAWRQRNELPIAAWLRSLYPD